MFDLFRISFLSRLVLLISCLSAYAGRAFSWYFVAAYETCSFSFFFLFSMEEVSICLADVLRHVLPGILPFVSFVWQQQQWRAHKQK